MPGDSGYPLGDVFNIFLPVMQQRTENKPCAPWTDV